jgi:uncharacterized protein
VIVGILSDTHNRVDAVAAGMKVLTTACAEFFIHCGDVGSQAVLDHLVGTPSLFVWGNNDWDRPLLSRYAASVGITCGGTFAELELAGRSFAVTHGDDQRVVRRVLSEQRHDYLLVGHSHVRHDERVGRVRIINPGALYRAAEKTVATLDTSIDLLQFHSVQVTSR